MKQHILQPARRPLLVTGSHRSGTTWVGNMISLSPEFRYVDEPFNLKYKRSPFQYWFEYIHKNNQHIFLPYLINEIKISRYLYWDLLNVQKRQDLKPRLRKIANQFKRKRPLIKDPIAILSTTWLAQRFGMDVIVLIRHPNGFVSSIKKLGWNHDFSQFLKQPELMKDHLQEFEEKIISVSEKQTDIIDQAILLWNIFHYMILKYMKSHPDWTFLRYEDIAASPIIEFEKLYKKLNLDYSSTIADQIQRCSSDDSSMEKDPYSINRNSAENIHVWKERLSNEEVERIKNGTLRIASQFY